MTHNYWLKMIGAADREVGDRWIEARPKLLSEVRFPKRPSGVRRGDYLVYYAAGDQKLFAIARAKGDGADASMSGPKDERRWPFVLEVQLLLAIPQLALAPHWKVLGLPSTTVTQMSHVGITHGQYRIAHAAMVERTAEA